MWKNWVRSLNRSTDKEKITEAILGADETIVPLANKKDRIKTATMFL